MMTSSMIFNCFATPNASLLPGGFTHAVLLMDASLTSCVALSFMFDGLVDLRLLSWDSVRDKLLMFGSYLCVAAAWEYCLETHRMKFAVRFLYEGLIGVCCGIFLVLEVIYVAQLPKGSRFAHGGFLVLAGISGFVGLLSFIKKTYLCINFPPLFEGCALLWFLGSDLALSFLYKYLYERLRQGENAETKPARIMYK